MTVHTGVLIVLCAAVAIAAGTVWVTRASRRRAANTLAEEAPHEAPVERRGRGRFLLPALLFVLFNAVTVVFSDGHHLGIYTFPMLRESDPQGPA